MPRPVKGVAERGDVLAQRPLIRVHEIEPDYVIHRFSHLPVALEFLQMH